MIANRVQIRGVVHLLKLPAKSKTVENDYLLALNITHINQEEVKTTAQAFEAFKKILPDIYINDRCINDIFINATSATNLPYMTLANYPDFHEDRDSSKPINKLFLSVAKSTIGLQLNFSVSPDDFDLVVVADNEEMTKPIRAGDAKLNVYATSDVGKGRDAILTYTPNSITQSFILDVTRKIFGNNYELWNHHGEAIPFHILVGQTNCMKELLEAAMPKKPEIEEERRNRPGM